MKIYLVRHGETDYNKASKFQGWIDVPLNEFGIELAVKTAEGLKEIEFDAAFSSPFQRAYVTAKTIIGNKTLTIQTDDRLKEVCFGPNEGNSYLEAKKDVNHPLHNFFNNPGSYSPTDGSESFDDVKKRVNNFLKEKIFPLEKKCQHVLITAHGCVNRCILNSILDIKNENFWQIKLPNCAVSIISLENGKFEVIEKCKVFY